MIKQRMILVTSRDDGARDDEVVEAAKEEWGMELLCFWIDLGCS